MRELLARCESASWAWVGVGSANGAVVTNGALAPTARNGVERTRPSSLGGLFAEVAGSAIASGCRETLGLAVFAGWAVQAVSCNAGAASHRVVGTDGALHGRFRSDNAVVTDGADSGLRHRLLVAVEASNARSARVLVVEGVVGGGGANDLCTCTFHSVVARRCWVLIVHTRSTKAVVTINAVARRAYSGTAVTVLTGGAKSAVLKGLHACVGVVVAGGARFSFEGALLTVSASGALSLLGHRAASGTVVTSIAKTSRRKGTRLSTEATLGAGCAFT